MKRSLIVITAFGLLLAVVSSAGAVTPRQIAATPSLTYAVGNGFVYWTKKGAIMRTDIATGVATEFATLRSGLTVWSIHAGGGFASASVYDRKTDISEVRRFDASGASTTLTTAKFKRKSRRSCGDFVSAGPITDAGEVTWQKWHSGSPGRKRVCNNAAFKTRLVSTNYRKPLAGPAEVFLPSHATTLITLGLDGVISDSRVRQVNDKYALVLTGTLKFALIERATGKTIRVRSSEVAHDPISLSLAADGSFIYGARTNAARLLSVPRIVHIDGNSVALKPQSSATEISRAVYCGSRIVQYEERTSDDDLPAIQVWTRALDGSNPVLLASEQELPKMSPLQMQCDGNRVVLGLIDEADDRDATYVLDLP